MKFAIAALAIALTGCAHPLLPGPTTRPSTAYIQADSDALAELSPAIHRDETNNPSNVASDESVIAAWNARISNPPIATIYLASETATFVSLVPIVQRDGDRGSAVRLDAMWQRLSAADTAVGVAVPSEPTTQP